MCVACHESLAVAQSPEAFSERQYIRDLIAQGETAAEIKRNMVAQYGTAVLAVPPAQGFNLVVYVLPPVLVGVGILVLALTIPRWRRRARGAGAGHPRRAAERRGHAPAQRGPRPVRVAASTVMTKLPSPGTFVTTAGRTRYIESGALTPSSCRASLIVCRDAWDSAIRKDSTSAGSAPTTWQSR